MHFHSYLLIYLIIIIILFITCRADGSLHSGHSLLPPNAYPGGPRSGLIPRPEMMHPGAGGLLRPPFDDPSSGPCLMNPMMQLRQQRF